MQLHTATNPLWQFFNAIFTDIQLAFSKYQLVPVYDSQPNTSKTALCSGRFRNVERPKILGCHAHFRSRWQSQLSN